VLFFLPPGEFSMSDLTFPALPRSVRSPRNVKINQPIGVTHGTAMGTLTGLTLDWGQITYFFIGPWSFFFFFQSDHRRVVQLRLVQHLLAHHVSSRIYVLSRGLSVPILRSISRHKLLTALFFSSTFVIYYCLSFAYVSRYNLQFGQNTFELPESAVPSKILPKEQ
jgi:hypothetical protein